MPDLNLGALTIPAFAAIFGAGWKAYDLFIAKDLRARLTKAEEKLDQWDAEKTAELARLREILHLSNQ